MATRRRAPTLTDLPEEIICNLGLKLSQAPTKHIRKLILATQQNDPGLRRMQSLGPVPFCTEINKKRLWFGADCVSAWTSLDTSEELSPYFAFADPVARLPHTCCENFAARFYRQRAVNVDPWLYTVEKPDYGDTQGGEVFVNLIPLSRDQEFASSRGLICVSLKLNRSDTGWTITEAAASFGLNEECCFEKVENIARLHLLPVQTDSIENLRAWSII